MTDTQFTERLAFLKSGIDAQMHLGLRIGLTVTARGDRRAEHPTVFTAIALDYVVRGPVDPAVVASALAQSEERICPVWAMLKPGTVLTSSFRVEP